MKILGITGGIAMGKSTVTRYIASKGIPVLQSDEVVAGLQMEQAVINAIHKAFPDAVQGGVIDKAVLRKNIARSQQHITTLEKIIHPAVIARYHEFFKENENAELVAIEVPLLYELSLDNLCDWIIVVYCSQDRQFERAMKRDGMTLEFLQAMIERQMPITDKLAAADFVINTDGTKEETIQLVDIVLNKLKG